MFGLIYEFIFINIFVHIHFAKTCFQNNTIISILQFFFTASCLMGYSTWDWSGLIRSYRLSCLRRKRSCNSKIRKNNSKKYLVNWIFTKILNYTNSILQGLWCFSAYIFRRLKISVIYTCVYNTFLRIRINILANKFIFLLIKTLNFNIKLIFQYFNY